ncbi:MAG: hypothetical protein LPK45_01075 [Bacteroidota bacterium]|nr:hypothetical protein [Bacteroidota bacterium]MDX5429620.1 hypothetical protein [Bacteroidota bacterium]MDX5468404.1 hypothetical protein [Bacteroidota bacterium]
MFTEKGQLSVQGGANIRFYQGQLAYSPSKYFGLIYGFNKVIPSTGKGFSHGLTLQHFGQFNRHSSLFYSMSLGYGYGNLDNHFQRKGRGEFYYGRYLEQSSSRYTNTSLACGLYWKLKEHNTQMGLQLDLNSIHYSHLRFSRTELDADPLGVEYDYSAGPGKKVCQVTSLVFSIRSSGKKGLFYFKESIGFRYDNDTQFTLYGADGTTHSSLYHLDIPYMVLNVQVGMNLSTLGRRFKKRD